MKIRSLVGLAAAFALALSEAVAQTVVSDFDSGLDGWLPYTAGRHDSTVAVSWDATGGLSGSGALVLNDPGSGADDYFTAPTKFLGNKSAYYGGTLSFDLKLTIPAGGLEADNVVLTGNGLSIAFAVSPYPNTSAFTSYPISLVETSGWYLVGTTTAPTSVQMQQLLGNLTEFRIMGDWGLGAEAERLDNVRLSAVPEPNTLALFASGAIVLAAGQYLRRRRAVAENR